MDIQVFIDAAGKDEKREVIAAFYSRSWGGSPCNLDDICGLAATRQVDPLPLMRLCSLVGEYPEDMIGAVLDYPIDHYSNKGL